MRFTPNQSTRHLGALAEAAGPVVLEAIAQPNIEDLVLNPDGSLWEKKQGVVWESIGTLEESAAWQFVETVASIRQTVVNEKSPILETTFPLDGSRFEAVLPPVVRRPCFALRIRRKTTRTLADYNAAGILTDRNDPLNACHKTEDFIRECAELKSHREILLHAIRKRQSIVVTGPTGSGKTSFSDVVLSEVGTVAPFDRILTIEDTPELFCDVLNTVDLLASEDEGVPMLRCLRVAMRLRPSRIVVGEVRGSEAHTLLKAWNTGHPGGIATVHANGAYEALVRLESLVAESTSAPQQSLIAEAVNLVVFIEEDARLAAGRKVREVIAVTGYDTNTHRYQFVSL
jgi:P-type conjugative transfer ATPase TrbB